MEIDNHGYVYVEKWGHFMGSGIDYIKRQCLAAYAAQAPMNAIYERDGVWQTTDGITNPHAWTAMDLTPTAHMLAGWFSGEMEGVSRRLEQLNETLRQWEEKGAEDATYSDAQSDTRVRNAASGVLGYATVIHRKVT